MLSKPLRPLNEIKNTKRNSLKKVNHLETYTLTYSDYFKKNVDLKKYKLPELKNIVKEYNLTRTGKKETLIQRIQELFQKMKVSAIIQKTFRGWMVRKSFELRGDAYKNRKLCVNDTDFVTLEPLEEIPYELFYSYKDVKQFVYGFNITSLVQIIKNKSPLKNPYNREKIPDNCIKDIIMLNNFTQIIYENFKEETEIIRLNNSFRLPTRARIAIVDETQELSSNFTREYLHPRIIPGNYNVTEMNVKYNFIVASRSKPINERIQNLFMEIDQLGNYTQSSWFSNLDRIGYLRFYRYLLDIWNYRAQLSYDVKKKICPFLEPFSNIFARNIHHVDSPIQDFQILCITAMENLIYSGFDDEYRKIFAFHLLSALTLVSFPARTAMPWLYESIVY
jgi:hypothetical protein